MPKNIPTDYWNYIPLIPKKFKDVASGSRALQIAFVNYVKQLGLNPRLSFHSLRHGFATHCIDKGIPLNQIQLLMGHTNIATTNVYLHANPKDSLKNYEDLF
jgi:integrase/recombinase XerD